jgi:hypothetical protein
VTYRIAFAAAACAALAGCSGGPRTAAPVEPDKARAALRTTLDAWKAGKSPESLARADPPIVAQDLDWMTGSKLTEYELADDGKAEDANLRVRVRLTVRDTQGKTTTKTAVYVVGTDPKLTVFRALE